MRFFSRFLHLNGLFFYFPSFLSIATALLDRTQLLERAELVEVKADRGKKIVLTHTRGTVVTETCVA